MDYFEFYDLPLQFQIDESELKKRFFQKTRENHPDFYTNAPEEEKAQALEQTSFNNKAYKVLSNEDSRIKYILELLGVIVTGQKDELPNEFLFEMMELNENIEAATTENDEPKREEIKQQLLNQQAVELDHIKQQLSNHQHKEDQFNPESTKHAYFKLKYFKRALENLSLIHI